MGQAPYREDIARLSALEELAPVLAELERVDAKAASTITRGIERTLQKSQRILADLDANPDRLRYGLYRQATELQAHMRPYGRLAESMAEREKTLWAHAFHCTERFFTEVTAAFEAYFRTKLEFMEKEIEEDASWYSGIRDTAKKAGNLVNLGKKGVARLVSRVSEPHHMDENDLIDTRSIVERTMATHLAPTDLANEMEQILKAATERFKSEWQKVIDENTPDMQDLRAFAGAGAARASFDVGFELGAAEGTLLVGVGGAVAASVGLAAGWHTITYALLNVFPPAAVFAVLATLVVAVATKERAKQSRLDTVHKAVEQYFRTLLTLINTEKLAELDGKTLREAMREQSEQIIRDTVARWTRAVCGKLSLEHYRALVTAADGHLQSIVRCLEVLGEDAVAPTAAGAR